jgi:hypothetical protein
MEPCVDLRVLRASPLTIHLWWFLTSVVVVGRGIVPLPDSSVAHWRVPG